MSYESCLKCFNISVSSTPNVVALCCFVVDRWHSIAISITGQKFTRQEAILIFATGKQILGTAGLKDKIFVEFAAEETDELPGAGTCTCQLVLPTKHETYEKFAEKMDKAFELELIGFGEA